MNVIKRKLEIYNLDKYDILVCVIATIVGGILRVLGYKWDGGHMIFQPDEHNMVEPVITFVETKTLSDSFTYPAQFFSKIQGIVLWQYVRETQAKLGWYMVDAFLVCRIFTAVIGALTIGVVFLIGNYLHKKVGTISAIILSVSPMMIMMSKQVTGDVTTLFLTSIVMLLALRYTEEQKKVYLIVMSLFSAMATMEKWHGGAAAAFIGIMVLLYAKSIKDFICRSVLAFIIWLLGIIVIAPNIVINIKRAADEFFGTATWDNAENPGYLNNLHSYIKSSFMGLGYVFVALTFMGIVLILIRREKRYVVLILGLVKVLMLSLMNRTMPRWGLELYLSQIIVMAGALCFLWERKQAIIRGGAVALLGITVVESALAAAVVDAIAMSPNQDIRCLQERFCVEKGITKDRTISSRYTAYVPGGIRADVEGEVVSDDCDNIFQVNGGEIYKIQDFDYYVWSDRTDTTDIIEKLNEKGLCIWQEQIDYYDIFWIPYYNIGKRRTETKNDYLLCNDLVKALIHINNGAIRGAYNIRIYDISALTLVD